MAALKQPGIADPYWYEWSVGLLKVIDMIAGIDAIESVTFQEAGIAGIDDVVIRYADGRPPTCYQVKHKTAGSEGRQSFTFGDLVSGGKDKPPLIASLVGAWIKASREWGKKPDVILYSNRDAGTRRVRRTFNGVEYKQHPLELFLEETQQECSSANDYAGLSFRDPDLQLQWQEFTEAADISDKDDLLEFMRHFSIDLNKPGLNDAMELIVDRLRENVLAGDARLAEQARDKLLASLREWTTAGVGRNVVNREKALRCLAKLNEKPLSRPIDVAVPKPAFESRMRLAAELGTLVQEGSESVYFVTGKPGIGKTRLMSMLCAQLSPAPFRFYAFKPLDSEDISFTPDCGQSSARELWSSLLNQLRPVAPDGMEGTSIPIVNELCTEDQLRSEVLRLASALADARCSSTILIIDGIDHAARAGGDVTFLDHLPSPDSLPAGVKLVLAGQPASLYPNYPAWLRRPSPNVSTIEIGPLDSKDIADLLMCKTALDTSAVALASKAIAAKTAGNTLSAVYAVQAVARLENGCDVLEEIRCMPISDNVIGYYERVWAKVRAAVEEGHAGAADSSLVMACTMHLLDGYVSPELLNGAFPEMFPQAYMAERALSCAAPLLRRTRDGAYCPLHNDFRLFVDGMASGPDAEPCLAYVTDKLATYLLATGASPIKSCYAVRLLARAGRERECLELFDTSFVIDSLSRGIPWDYLCEQAETVYGCACSASSIEAVSKSLLAAATLSQANEHFDYLQESRPFSHVDRITYQDMLVAPLDAQHIYSYKQALDRAVWLAGDCALPEEAAVLFDIWTAGMSPSQFAQAIWGTDYASFNHNEEQEFEQLCITWGAYAALADVEYPDLDRDYWVGSGVDDALLSFRDSYVRQRVVTNHDAATIAQSFQRSGMTQKGVHNLLRDGMARNHEISGAGFRTFLSTLGSRAGNPYERIAIALLMLSGEMSAFPDQFDDELLSERKLSYYATDETLLQLAAECFLFGISCQLSKCEDAILSARHHLAWIDATQREYAELMHCVDALTCLGFVISHGQTILPDTSEAIVLSRCLTDNYHVGFDPLTMIFVQHAIFNSSFRDLWKSALVEDDMEVLALSGRFTSCKLPLLDFLAETGNLTLLSTAIDAAYGDGGSRILASSDALGMHEMLRRYAAIIDEELVKKCDKAVFANIASFTEHKDYSLSHAVDLYRIAYETGNATESDTRLLLTIDSIANETGDNRVSESTTAAVIAWAVGGGPRRLGKVRSWIPALRYDYDDLALQASALLGTAASIEDVHACFALLYGTTTYYRESGLLQMRSFAKECCAKIDSLGFGPKAKGPILSAVEPFSELSLSPSQTGSTSTQRLIPNAPIEPSPSTLSIEELEDIAFRKPQGKWEWDEVEAAYSELLLRERPREDTTEELVNSRLSEFSQGGWAHFSQSLMQIIKMVAEHASDGAFFKLLEARKENLHLYGFGSSVEDVRFAIAHRVKTRNPEIAASLLRDELQSKKLWVTANGHLPLTLVYNDEPEMPSPNSITDLVTDALFESLVEQDPHRCEDAVRGISWGGLLSEDMRNRFADLTKLGSAYQRQLAWKVIDFWLCNEASNSAYLIEAVAEAHAATRRLDEALLTALVVGMPQLLPRPKNPPEKPPAEGKLASLPHRAKDFFRAMGLLAHDDCDDLRAEILQCNVGPGDCIDVIGRYGRREDIENPGHDADELFQEILLREQRSGRWRGASLGGIASLLFDPADAWVMRRLPTMTENFRTSVIKLAEELEGGNECDAESRAREIACTDLLPGEDAIAWVLYLPYGEKDELRIFHVPKLLIAGEEINVDDVDAAFGCYGIMAGRSDMFVVPKSQAGIPLFGEQIGTVSMVDCDCEVLPCRTLSMLGLSPTDDDPMTWTNEEAVTAMRFERLICPADGGFRRDMYYRQPQLWRWVGKMKMLETGASKLGFSLHETEISRRSTDTIRERMDRHRAIVIAPPFA